jgi:hypothetical protein
VKKNPWCDFFVAPFLHQASGNVFQAWSNLPQAFNTCAKHLKICCKHPIPCPSPSKSRFKPCYSSAMSLILVNSSSIRVVGWSSNHLFVQFHTSDEIYDHPGVPYSVYVEFMNAPSMGAYYNFESTYL